MRLLDAQDLALVEFPPNKIPTYVILSHTWTDSEVSYAEFTKPAAKSKLGFQKIVKFCEKVVEAGFRYAWVDTCCIDKSSSAELSEAINSMYTWYRRAAICYAYLVDVDSDTFLDGYGPAFRGSRWFLRGWTLQELLAPTDVLFFSSDWMQLRSRNNMDHEISSITGIRKGILTKNLPTQSASVAERMSWASNRETTRREDMAYCLMGLFGVNMPMLYGEGDKAFRRLQEEILKTPNDQSLFAWFHTQDDQMLSGLLAPHPRNFADSGRFEDLSELPELRGQRISTISQGIELDVFLARVDELGFCYATLKCAENGSAASFALITLQSCMPPEEEYIRMNVGFRNLLRGPIRGRQTRILVRHELPQMTSLLEHRYCQFQFVSQDPHDRALAYLPASPLVEDEGLQLCDINGSPYYLIKRPKYRFRMPILPFTEVLKVKVITRKAEIALSIGLNNYGVLSFSANWTGRFEDGMPEQYISGNRVKTLTHPSRPLKVRLGQTDVLGQENAGRVLFGLDLWLESVSTEAHVNK